jgi:tetratricopeptide (TPR) repeat protein
MRAGGDYFVSGANAIKEEGNALHNQGKYAEAAEKYQAAKQNLHGNASASAQQVKMSCCLNLASCYLKTGQHDLVVEECSNVIQMDAKNLKALYRRGQAYAAMGRHSMAESDLAAAQRVNPQDEHVAAALRDVRTTCEAAGDAGDYSFDGDRQKEDGGSQVSGGLAALAAAMKAESGEEKEEKKGKAEAGEAEAAGTGAPAGMAKAEGPTREELEKKSIKELREMCKTKGLDYSSCVDKNDMVDLITSNPHATALSAPAAAAAPAGMGAMGGMPSPANMSASQLEQAKKMMENPAMMNSAINMMKNMDPATLANMFNMQYGTNHWTPEMAKQHIEMLQRPGVAEQAAQQMQNLSPQQIADLAKQSQQAIAGNGGIVPPGMSSTELPQSNRPAEQHTSVPAAVGRIDADDVRSALANPPPAAAGVPGMTPQLQQQMEMMKNNPEMMKQSINMMKNMDDETMAKMLEAQSSMYGMKVTPEMAKMSAAMMKNMDPAQMEKMMSMAGSMGGMGGMGGMGAMGGAHMGAAAADGAAGGGAAQRGGGMPQMQMDPATGMPVVTPEMQKQMSSMMRDPEMRKNLANMMKNMDPELMKSMGISDKAQIDKAAEAMEKMSPETVDRLMSVAVGGQRAYIFYKTHLWFRCLLQLTMMYLVYYFFGGWAMRTVAYFTGSSSPAAAAPLSAGPAAVGGAVNAGEGKAERDWSGKATANLVDDDEVSSPLLQPHSLCLCPCCCGTASAIPCVCVCVCREREGGPCFAAGALCCWCWCPLLLVLVLRWCCVRKMN